MEAEGYCVPVNSGLQALRYWYLCGIDKEIGRACSMIVAMKNLTFQLYEATL
jgi:hypothetical protein